MHLVFTVVIAVFIALGTTSAHAAFTFVESHVDGQSGVNGLDMAQDVVVTPDGSHVYAVSAGDDSIVHFNRNVGTGKLTFVEAIVNGVGGVTGIASASAVAVSPDGRHIYVTSGANTGAIAVFARNPATGALSVVETEVNGQNGVSGLTVAHDVAVSPDGKHVYAIGFSPGAILTFSRNQTTGALTFVEKDEEGVNGLDGIALATALVISPDGKHVYVTGNSDDSVAVFSRNASTGALALVEVKRDGVGGVDGIDGPFAIAISDDGAHVYAAGSTDDGIAVFSRDPSDGKLNFVQAYHEGVGGMDGLNDPSAIVVTSDGAHVLVAAAGESEIGVFARDPGSGGLTFVNTIGGAALGGVNSLRLAPGGKHLYTTGRSSDTVALYEDPSVVTTTTTSTSTSTSTSTIVTTTTPSTSTSSTTNTTATPTTSSTTTTNGGGTTLPTTTTTHPTTSSTSVPPTSTSTAVTTSSTSTTASEPTTTVPAPTTSTTTLPDATCAILPTFESIECRLQALQDETVGAMALGGLRPKLNDSVGKAADRVAAAHGICSFSKRKIARQRLKRASIQLTRFVRRLRGRAAQGIPVPVREPLAAAADAIAADLNTLRRAMVCPIDA